MAKKGKSALPPHDIVVHRDAQGVERDTPSRLVGPGYRLPGASAETVTEPAAPVLILVRSPKGAPFWEKHADHPSGEVWVAGDGGKPGRAVQVARTGAVERALKDGRLELAA